MEASKKRLILFTEAFPYGDGEQFLETEIEYLAKCFDEILVIPFKSGCRGKIKNLPKNVRTEEPLFGLSKTKLILRGIFNIAPVGFGIKEFFKKRVFLNIKRLKSWLETTLQIRILLRNKVIRSVFSKEYSCCIYYFYWGLYAANIIPFVAESMRTPKIVRFHGSDLYEEVSHNYIPYRDLLLNSMSFGLCVSQNGLDYLKKRYASIPFEAGVFRLGVKGNGMSKASTDDVLRILTCSSLVPVKRIHLIIDALRDLTIKVHWTHIGSGPLEKKLKSMAESLPANIEINFTGKLDNQEVYEFYRSQPVDLFINVSESEGMPVTIMEALSMGVPILAADVGGVGEIVDGTVGRILDKNVSPDKIGEEMNDFYRMTEEDKKNLRAGAFEKWKERCNADKEYKKLYSFLDNLYLNFRA